MVMRQVFASIAVVVISLIGFAEAQTSSARQDIPAAGGTIRFTPIKHASFQIFYNNRVIQVDPISTNDNRNAAMADLVLVTDIHGDHMDAKAINQFRKPAARVIAPAAVAKALGESVRDVTVLGNGQIRTDNDISIEAVPMYNLVRGPAAGQLFHDKGRGNGYVITIGGKRLYIAGDTECIPEMKALKDIDVAFVPMNLPYTMTPAEAAACVKAFRPKVVYPYHYNQASNAQEFAAALKGSGIEVRLADWYPGTPAPAR
jgi:L-ascorbate metabolism protein UlaG (beta-lactamase superfamily)